MHRYYMTAATRDAVIAESNRLLAARAATRGQRLSAPASDGTDSAGDSEWDAAEAGAQASDLESAFARLVTDLQSASSRIRLS